MINQDAKARIAGQIIDEKGVPVGGVMITCDGEENRTLFDGSYKFDDLEPGPHIIEIALEGYGIQRREIEAREGGESTLDFHLEPEAGDAKIYGYVLDKVTGEPARTGGSLYMYRLTSNRSISFDPETGYFEVVHLPPGTYTLWTSVLGYEDEKKTVVVEEGDERRTDFLIRKAEIEPPLG
ncbi:hypothetical protein AC482_00290 [miscellaneous Crenarchaeota group-15 archaeon DG-45]|uniref:PEGA domain-containing protein n=1 Tax=miscellaneous Crenarchaeota group-15 archaeon DG-45 TaxID=1685127 RepID=A0A0M0BSI9_9ARCH|nr:MAG: hypothetical protein AC482_00290 [miscellaneous Crenarchaeota group-15 archaeon DG-45]